MISADILLIKFRQYFYYAINYFLAKYLFNSYHFLFY